MDGAMEPGAGELGGHDGDLRAQVDRLAGEVGRLAGEERRLTAEVGRQAALVDELRARPERERRGLSRAARLSLAGLLVFLIGTVPSVLAHTGYFSDVPHGAQFHAEINEIAGAGITTGCTATPTYCPDATVDRKAMAAFMSRGFGRAYHDSFNLILADGGGAFKDFAFKTGLPANLLSGAQGFVKADVSFSMGLSGTASGSCLYKFYVTAQPGQPSQVSLAAQVYNLTLSNTNSQRNITLTGLGPVSTSTPTIQVNVVQTGICGSGAVAVGDIVITYFPLSGV